LLLAFILYQSSELGLLFSRMVVSPVVKQDNFGFGVSLVLWSVGVGRDNFWILKSFFISMQ
jgi:hypothetical protein